MESRLFAEKGQIMKQQVTSYQLEIIEERQAANGVYTLLHLAHGKLLRYAVAIEDDSGAEIAWFDGNEAACRTIFDRMVSGSLSCLHLKDVAADFCCENALEIF